MSTSLLPASSREPLPDLSEDSPAPFTSKIFVLVAVGAPTLIILAIMSGFIRNIGLDGDFPYLHLDLRLFPALLRDNTPTGGDMGAHVLLPQILRDELLPSGRILGWTTAWYAGFPAFYFYFPLPALFTVLVDVVIPYGVAFKLSTIVGLVLLPASVYSLVRALGFARVVSGFAAFGGSMFVFMESFAILGGNIKSTLAGEFSFSWSLALSLFYLGMVTRSTREGRPFSPWAGVLLALTALSHVVTTIVVVIASLPLLLRRHGVRTVLPAWGLGLALSAFWAIPLAVRGLQGFSTDMHWDPVRGLVGETFSPGIIATPFPDEFVPVAVLGLLGLVWALVRREDVAVLAALTIVPVLLYIFLPLQGITRLYNGRLLPFWYLGGYIFAGLALGLAVMALARTYPQRKQALITVAAVGLLVPANVALLGVQDAPGWVSWNYMGFEDKAQYSEYEALMETIDGLPPGRVMWEINADQGRYGTPMALMLIPYWTEGHSQSMEGVFFESSVTTPFHFLTGSEVSQAPSNAVRGLNYRGMDFSRGVIHMGLYDIEHYVSFTPEATEAAEQFGLVPVARPEPWTIFDLPEYSFVDVATRQPVVYAGEEEFLDVALEWYDDVASLDYWVTAEGPEEWPRIQSLGERFARGRPLPAGDPVISDVVVDNDRIEFTTNAVGVPHMVKMSHFPNWTVTEGGDGPYRAAPSLMVVVPTDERVVLQFRPTGVENLGNFLTLAGIAGVAAWMWDRRRRQQDELKTEPA